MDITTAKVYEHEMAKNDDFQYGFESLIRNTAVLDRMLISADTDYVIGGEVTADSESFGVRAGTMWGNGLALEMPVYGNAVSELIPLVLPLENIRIDTLQVKSVFEEFDEQRRAFFNPETGAGEYFAVPTKAKLKTEYQIKQGTEGHQIAPETDDGWIKLAEIVLEPGMNTVPTENIRNITAIYQGEENTAWTNEKSRTFQLGSYLQLKEILAKEHTITGEHRQKVIHAGNIDFGIETDQVNSKTIPFGGDYTAGTSGLNAEDSLFAVLRKTADEITAILQSIEDMVHEAPDDGSAYNRKNKMWIAAAGGSGGTLGDAIEALKFYSKKTLMITNTRIVDRRKRGWDIGLPYLSSASRVYHFDTDTNDQNQRTNLEIISTSGAPALVSGDDTNGQIYLNPAVLAVPPYEMKGRSLYGHFSLKTKPETLTERFTAEARIRLFDDRSAVVLRLDSGMESLTLRIGNRGSAEPVYSAAEADGIAYNIGETQEYNAAEADGVVYSLSEADGIVYSASEAPILYSSATAGTDPGNIALHEWLNGEETISLDDEGIAIPKKTWIHIAAVATLNILALYIGDRTIEFEKKSESAQAFSLLLNPAKNEFNVDELMLDETAVVNFNDFTENTVNRVPYAALDYREKWFVIEAQDPNKVKTNLFETEQFRTAVQKILDTQGV